MHLHNLYNVFKKIDYRKVQCKFVKIINIRRNHFNRFTRQSSWKGYKKIPPVTNKTKTSNIYFFRISTAGIFNVLKGGELFCKQHHMYRCEYLIREILNVYHEMEGVASMVKNAILQFYWCVKVFGLFECYRFIFVNTSPSNVTLVIFLIWGKQIKLIVKKINFCLLNVRFKPVNIQGESKVKNITQKYVLIVNVLIGTSVTEWYT